MNRQPNEPEFDEYMTPCEAADRLYSLCGELEKHNLAPEFIEELRQISLRFTSHLNAREGFVEHLKAFERALLC